MSTHPTAPTSTDRPDDRSDDRSGADVPPDAPLDAVIVGGGPAGLQAALTLGRMHRSVLLLDSGSYRNDWAEHMHNVVTHDGTPPAEFRAAARKDLAAYDTVEVRDAAVATIARAGAQHDGDGAGADDGDRFRVDLEDGTAVTARAVLLATGLRDTLPDVPGLEELFGTVAAHCPYCHGHEFSGTPVAVLGSGPHVAKVAFLVERIASRVVVLADGEELDAGVRRVLDHAGVAVRPEPVTGVRREGDGARVTFASGPDELVGGLFVAPTTAQAAPFAEQLGLTTLPSGCVEVDPFGRTSEAGVFAAGDMAHTAALPMPQAAVLAAAAAGLTAATGVDAHLLAEDHHLPV
ncbi:NAD(P)/FAD-dependent oxidoreductase [Puerhibacterium puerhi]|uniref:NAD(P)/FAD-dependent oxidoreductase n=1 Tax=Puerhibacterium puerhi TaxID=2692623 RepID=UPI001F18E0ED|nr:NAD(P)/FAD-dependent oxidoreductase [Puerhibacterium puerhi]